MSRVDFENKITNRGLAKKAPHFDLGMTAKIPKEVENFKPDIPTGHHESNARPDLSSLSFHRNSRAFNDLPKTPAHHTSAQVHMPNFYYTNLNAEKEKRHTPIETNFLNRMYGIPPDREMKFDNPAAVIMGADKMSEKDFAIKTWQAQEKGFMTLFEEQEANREAGIPEEHHEETKTNDATSNPPETIPEGSGGSGQIEVKPAFETNLPPPPPEKGEENAPKKRVRVKQVLD